MGNAYFGAAIHSALPFWLATGNNAWADDHGTGLLFMLRACVPAPFPLTVTSGVMAGMTPVHAWVGNGLPGVDIIPTHYLAPVSLLFSVWPPYADYNFLKVVMEDDAYGQPKNIAVVQRNYHQRTSPDPWNLLFRFSFSNSGSGASFGPGSPSDRNSVQLQDGTDVSLQTAMATGIAYYHRYGHWKEPPNLFNPFWRAGLARANIDPQPTGGGRIWYNDVEEALTNSNVPWAASSVKPLLQAGYQGVQ
jgi:hypothetical protein